MAQSNLQNRTCSLLLQEASSIKFDKIEQLMTNTYTQYTHEILLNETRITHFNLLEKKIKRQHQMLSTALGSKFMLPDTPPVLSW